MCGNGKLSWCLAPSHTLVHILVTTHMVLSNVDSFDVLVRKSVFNFKNKRLLKSGNRILSAIVNSLYVHRMSVWSYLQQMVKCFLLTYW